MRVDVHDGFLAEAYLHGVEPEDCAAVIRTTCRMCRRTPMVAVSHDWMAEAKRKYRDRWPVAWFAEQGWQADDVDRGICPQCLELMGLVTWRKN